jgi:hypothetical protein
MGTSRPRRVSDLVRAQLGQDDVDSHAAGPVASPELTALYARITGRLWAGKNGG